MPSRCIPTTSSCPASSCARPAAKRRARPCTGFSTTAGWPCSFRRHVLLIRAPSITVVLWSSSDADFLHDVWGHVSTLRPRLPTLTLHVRKCCSWEVQSCLSSLLCTCCLQCPAHSQAFRPADSSSHTRGGSDPVRGSLRAVHPLSANRCSSCPAGVAHDVQGHVSVFLTTPGSLMNMLHVLHKVAILDQVRESNLHFPCYPAVG